jgi:glucan phosphoethanolaminetransferase (alkaline phosphatase superfamily)
MDMSIYKIIGLSIFGVFFTALFFMFALFETDGFKGMPWATITVILLIIACFLINNLILWINL